MRKHIVAIAVAATLAWAGAASNPPLSFAEGDVDCSKVIKAKEDAGVSVSTKDLAQRLNLPVEKVQECLLKLRQGPRPTAVH